MSRASLAPTIRDALPLLMREQVIDAVLAAQAIAGAPVTAQEARAATSGPVMRNAKSFSECARRIAELGADEQGRTLRCAGRDRLNVLLWWVSIGGGHQP
jgi:hypothetical protein